MSQNTGPESQQAIALSPRQERAIVARDNMEVGAAPAPLVPRTFLEAQSFAAALAQSPLMPEALRRQEANVLVVLLAGIEMGLTPMQSIRLHHVIEGVPRLSSAGIAGIVISSPLCEYLRCTESTETSSTWVTKRKGEPERSCTWNKARAERAGLWGKRTWATYPTNLLNARARKELCEMVYPDICAGLVSQEEAEDMAADKERSAPPVFVAPQGPPPGVPIPAAQAAESAAAQAAPKKPRAAKDKPIDTTATERPTTAVPAAAASTPSSMNPSASTGSTASSTPSSGSSATSTPASAVQADSHVAALDAMPPTPASKLDEARAKVEAKRERPTAAPVTQSDSPASEPSGGDAPESSDEGDPEPGWDDDEAEPVRTLEGFYAWLAKPKENQRQLKEEVTPWIDWSKKEFAADSEELAQLRRKYADRKAALPA